MQTKRLEFSFELKAINEDGTFTGYGSVFGVKDSYDEIVVPGAFVESLSVRKPALLWQHRSGEPIGVFTEIEEDNIGLKMTGRLALKTQRGQEAYELLKMGAVSGMSIGFQTREGSYDKVSGVRTLKKVDLWETSLVTFPACDAARVQSVKGVEQIEDLKAAEQYLRDSGFSRREAVAFIARVKCLGQSDSEEGEMQQIVEALKRLNEAIAA
jgi:hypothetical protein